MTHVKLALALVLLAGPVCAETAPACEAGLHPATTAELFFGRDVGTEVGVSEDDWRTFVDAEVTPRFPDGLTVDDVYGQYRGANNVFVREPAKAMLVVLGRTGDEFAKLQAIRDAYKGRFHQESVMLVEHSACVSF